MMNVKDSSGRCRMGVNDPFNGKLKRRIADRFKNSVDPQTFMDVLGERPKNFLNDNIEADVKSVLKRQTKRMANGNLLDHLVLQRKWFPTVLSVLRDERIGGEELADSFAKSEDDLKHESPVTETDTDNGNSIKRSIVTSAHRYNTIAKTIETPLFMHGLDEIDGFVKPQVHNPLERKVHCASTDRMTLADMALHVHKPPDYINYDVNALSRLSEIHLEDDDHNDSRELESKLHQSRLRSKGSMIDGHGTSITNSRDYNPSIVSTFQLTDDDHTKSPMYGMVGGTTTSTSKQISNSSTLFEATNSTFLNQSTHVPLELYDDCLSKQTELYDLPMDRDSRTCDAHDPTTQNAAVCITAYEFMENINAFDQGFDPSFIFPSKETRNAIFKDSDAEDSASIIHDQHFKSQVDNCLTGRPKSRNKMIHAKAQDCPSLSLPEFEIEQKRKKSRSKKDHHHNRNLSMFGCADHTFTQTRQRRANEREQFTQEEADKYLGVLPSYLSTSTANIVQASLSTKQNGTCAVWYSDDTKSIELSVMTGGEVVHFEIRKLCGWRGTEFYINKDQKIDMSLVELIDYHMECGILDMRSKTYNRRIDIHWSISKIMRT